MTIKQKDYLSTREAAECLDVAVSTVQLWTNSGILRAWTTAGGHRRIVRSSVDEMLRQQLLASEGEGEGTELYSEEPEQTISIVAVDDNVQQLRLYEKQLNVSKIMSTLVTAKDGYDGLVKIGSTLPDVIITDLIMPDFDGFQMIKALKTLPELEHSLIIVVTGLNEYDVNKRGALPEGVHLLIKPFPFEELEAIIRQYARLKLM